MSEQLTPEDIDSIWNAIDVVAGFTPVGRKQVEQDLQKVRVEICRLELWLALPHQDHADILQLGAAEERAERLTQKLANWSKMGAEALAHLRRVAGVGTRRAVTPQTHALVQALCKVTRKQADGTESRLSLAFVALACGVSEGTASKLRSGSYPTSSFPQTVKRGRRSAIR